MLRRHAVTPGRYITWDTDVRSELGRIAKEIEPQVREATHRGALAIAATAKELVPVETGALRRAIHVRFQGDADWLVVAGNHDAFYGHIVEYGSARGVSARPFLVPAGEVHRETLRALVVEALRDLE
jgi:HK97 gp10 family phage protein